MKEYDLAFSLGFSCGTSQALRAAGMQFASYPLDWLGSRDIRRVVKVVAGNFEKWFEKEDFQLVDVWHSTGFDTRAYLNTRTGLGFSHEFSDFVPFDESFPKIRETYGRRVQRFLECADASRKMLAVFLEMPVLPCASVKELEEARIKYRQANRFDRTALGSEILKAEKEVEQLRADIKATEKKIRIVENIAINN